MKNSINSRIGFDKEILLILLLLICSPDALSFQIVAPNQNGWVDASDDPPEVSRELYEGHRHDIVPYRSSSKLHNLPPGIYGNEETRAFTKALLKAISKRTDFANSEEEMEQKDIGIGLVKKRNNDDEWHGGGCNATWQWKPLGTDHFPRNLRNFKCSSNLCNRDYGECRPKSFTVFVLKRRETTVAEQECDQNLPDELKCAWKWERVNITSYCECIQRAIFGR